MDNKNTSLIIANMFIVGAFVVNNVIEWAILLMISILWLFNYLIQATHEIRQQERKITYLKILHEIMENVEKEKTPPKKRK